MARGIRRSATYAPDSALVQHNGYANVEYVREELRTVKPLYDMVADCVQGSAAVKAAGDKYLPRPNSEDTSPENQARYAAYLRRAVFYNVTRRTVFALSGQVFLRAPQIDLPEKLNYIVTDANGEHIPLEQYAERTCRNVFSFGRAGLLGDFPTTGGNVSASDLAAEDYRPTLTSYSSRDIINWRKALRGSTTVYTLIVVREPWHVMDNGFATQKLFQYKVLRLVPVDTMRAILAQKFPGGIDDTLTIALNNATVKKTDVYYMEVWRNVYDTNGNSNGFMPVEQYFPTGANGDFLHEIPWQFIGSEHNNDNIDYPPVADLSELNLAHYRNSADYEETSFLTGQPTPYVSGVTEEWVKNVFKGVVQLGSRGVIPLPAGGTAGLLQASANSIPFEAMQHKERQMVALGAKLVEQRQVQRTATEAEMEGASDTSVLATVAKNVSNAYEAMLKRLCVFTGDNPNDVHFSLNAEFDLTRMDANERAELILEWQSGAITTEEMRGNLRRGGVAQLDDASYREQVAIDEAARLAKARAKAEALAPPATQAKGADPHNPPGRNPAKPSQPVKGA